MGNKHLKPTNLQIEGTTVTDPSVLYQAYNGGVFRYQFQNQDGTRSRIMRCSSTSELLWLTEQVAKGDPVVIDEPVPI